MASMPDHSFSPLDRMLVAGEWVESSSGRHIDVINPSSEEVVGTVPEATSADLDRALDAVASGYEVWRTTDSWSRSALLRRIADLVRERVDLISAIMTEESGKPITESRTEVLAAADEFDWSADEARRIYGRIVNGHSTETRIFVARRPVGPVAAFTAWNFPAILPARKVAPALAAGCSIVIKPSEETPRTMMALAHACIDAGVPSGVVNVVTGDPAMISSHLIASNVIAKVSLTGSVPVGRELLHRAADRIIPVSLELGGHAPVLVFADADVGAAVDTCVRGKFRNCGQVCISPSRFYLEDAVRDEFIEKFTHRVKGLCVGDPRSSETDIGPLSSVRRRDAVERLIADAHAKGAEIVVGGSRCDPLGTGRGYFFEPTVITSASSEMAMMTEEPFGPIAPISTFDGLENGLAQANATPYGLAGFLFTRDLRTAHLCAERLQVGMVGVNNMVISTSEAPFGGVKMSGTSREGGTEGIESYTVTQYINMKL